MTDWTDNDDAAVRKARETLCELHAKLWNHLDDLSAASIDALREGDELGAEALNSEKLATLRCALAVLNSGAFGEK